MAEIPGIGSTSPAYLNQLLSKGNGMLGTGGAEQLGGNQFQNLMGGPQALEKISSLKPSQATQAIQGFGDKFNEWLPPASLEGAGRDIGRSLSAAGASPQFGNLVGNLISQVNAKQAISAESARQVMAGESDNLHQAVIHMREAGVAFNLLVEVRNKLTESFREIMRMQI